MCITWGDLNQYSFPGGQECDRAMLHHLIHSCLRRRHEDVKPASILDVIWAHLPTDAFRIFLCDQPPANADLLLGCITPLSQAASLCSTVLKGPNKIHGPCSFRNTYIARQDDEVGRLQDSQSSLVFTCHCWLRICVRYSSIASVQAYLPPPACTRVLGGEPDRYACLALGSSIPLLQKITLYHHPT